MRLSTQQQMTIKQILAKHFGSNSEIRLFGSRLDDRAKGGDIDVYIEPELVSVDEIVEAKINALVELQLELGEQKIDLVINRKKRPRLADLPYSQAARGVVVNKDAYLSLLDICHTHADRLRWSMKELVKHKPFTPPLQGGL